MKRIPILLASLFPLLACAAEVRFTGEATPVGGGAPLYEERHQVEGECRDGMFRPSSHTVTYVRGGDGTFAEKRLSYDQSPLRPSVDFRQPDFDEVMDITNRNDRELEIKWQKPDGSTDTSTVEVTDSLVADAGFDNLVRRHWSDVTSDKSVKFDFLAPTRGKAYGFVLDGVSDDRIDAAQTVRIKPSGTLLGFLVDPILLGYNEEGFLTHYLGLTNIRKDKDRNYTAHIRYTLEITPDCELTR